MPATPNNLDGTDQESVRQLFPVESQKIVLEPITTVFAGVDINTLSDVCRRSPIFSDLDSP